MIEVTKNLQLSTWHRIVDGVPLGVGVGIARSGPIWTVYLAWKEEDNFCWTKLIAEKDLSTPKDFFHYTTFTWRLYSYAQLYKNAIKQVVDEINVRHSGPRVQLSCLLC
jgi:hypothetical protein